METFFLIKPDGTRRNLCGKILSTIENSGFEITKLKLLTLSEDLAKEFYMEHNTKPFFSTMIKLITSGKVLAGTLKSSEKIIENFRELIGATNPANASFGTIRKTYGLSIDENTIHGSDSIESANREQKLFF